MPVIKKRERDSVLQSLQAGLVPRQGLHLIQVGRKLEVEAMLSDLERVTDGGSAFRIIIGRWGSGKSFFLNLIRTLALQKRIVVAHADMTIERRLSASGGQARALYRELMNNLATKGRPDGGALRSILEGWISNLHHEVTSAGGDDSQVVRRIMNDLRDLQDHVGGFEFAQVLAKYYEGWRNADEMLQSAALRWLRGEYTTKTEARHDLGVRRIISDEDFYDSIKLMAAFLRRADYAGLLVNLDEMVVLSHRLPSSRSRQTNYEAILAIVNDCLQGSVEGLGFLLAGTDEFLEDKRRGVASYAALHSRLAENKLAVDGIIDLAGPVVRLQNLTPEDLFVLLKNIRHVHAMGDSSKYIVPNEALVAVLQRANDTLGAEFYKTPRDVVRSFVGLLNVVQQNPGLDWTKVVGDGFIKRPEVAMTTEEEVAQGVGALDDSGDDLETFRI